MADITLNALTGTRNDASLPTRFRTWLKTRAEYRRTLAELQSLDRRTLSDLGIAPADFRTIARQATFGR